MSRRFEDLVALQARLLAPGGCPWDREQTHASLRTYLLEEAYEVLETIDSGDHEKLPDELGDLLLQVVFHAQLAKQAGHFDIGDVVERIYHKLVRRHPHVFGDVKVDTAGQVLKNWEQLKAEERRAGKSCKSRGAAGRAQKGTVGASPGIGSAPESEMEHPAGEPAESLLDGVPKTLPATLEGYQLTRRASRIGFDWDDLEGLLDKLKEEVGELRRAHLEGDTARREEEIGDLLFVAVNVARFLGVDPEIALKRANRKFSARFREMEREAARQGRRLGDASKDELETLWEKAKAKLGHASRGLGTVGSKEER